MRFFPLLAATVCVLFGQSPGVNAYNAHIGTYSLVSNGGSTVAANSCDAVNSDSIYLTCNSNSASSGWQFKGYSGNTQCSGTASKSISTNTGTSCIYSNGQYVKVDCSGAAASASSGSSATTAAASSNAVVIDAWTNSESCSGTATSVPSTSGACNSLASFGKSASTQVVCSGTSSDSGWTAYVYSGTTCSGSSSGNLSGSGEQCVSLASVGLTGASVAVNCAGSTFSSASKTGAAAGPAVGVVGAVAATLAAAVVAMVA